MFVLAYEVHYEGQSVLGVYSTLDAALAAVQRYTEGRRSIMHQDLVIRHIELDADASFEAGVMVWEYPED